jgi:hypothetical protein
VLGGTVQQFGLWSLRPQRGQRPELAVGLRYKQLFSRIEQSRLYDYAMRLPIVLYSFYALVHDVISFSGQVA